MAPEKAPAFQFYPKDFLSDSHQAEMSLQEVGAYARLLCRCWLEQSIPDDANRAANLCGAVPSHMKKMWPAIRRCFRPHPDEPGRLVHPRLEKERDKQETYRRRQSDRAVANLAGASREKGGQFTSRAPAKPREDHQPDTSRTPADDQPEHQPVTSSPISDLRSPIGTPSEFRREREDFVGDLSERAGRLREELYPAWYAKFRHGAKLRVPIIANSLEYKEAMSLVSTWDDARIEKLAKIVLTTDDPFIAGTDRGFKIFAMKATWADERLSVWEHDHQVQA